jgi:hypothetical protein
MKRALFAVVCFMVLASNSAMARGGTNAHEIVGIHQSVDVTPKPHWQQACCPPC